MLKVKRILKSKRRYNSSLKVLKMQLKRWWVERKL